MTSNNADADAYQALSNATLARQEVGCELEQLAKEQAESGSPTSARIGVVTNMRHLERIERQPGLHREFRTERCAECGAENLLCATWRRVSLSSRIPAVAARDWRTLAEQEGGTQMRTITSFLLPARTSCTRSFRHVQLSVPPRQAAV